MRSGTKEPCPACSSLDSQTIGPTSGGDYARCLKCGLEHRIPDAGESAAECFEAAQSVCYGEHGVLEPPHVQRMHRAIARRRLAIIRRYLSRGTLLEVGPGTGQLLRYAKAAGYEMEGVEQSPALASLLRRELAIPIHCGAFEEIDFSGRQYDAVLSMHVIEHVPDPVRHLTTARARVRPTGYLFLATPNLGGWARRIAGRRWPGYSAGHLCLFNSSSLMRCLRGAGWTVVGIHTNEGPINWLWVLTNMMRNPQRKRNLADYGSLARKTPSLAAAMATGLFRTFSWPLRRVQEVFRGGYELFLVARAVD